MFLQAGQSEAPEYSPPPGEPVLLHVDAALLIVDKPAGLLSVPGRGEAKADSLTSRLQQRFPDALTVHRLDMETSGIMLFARGAVHQRSLSMAFATREIAKTYVALVAGRPPEAGLIDLPLLTDWPNRPRQKVDHLSGKASLTRYRLIEHDTTRQRSRLILNPETGRSHQLRVHLASIGHPILGDALYADPAARAAAPRLMLHASALGFSHPLTGEPLTFDCPPAF